MDPGSIAQWAAVCCAAVFSAAGLVRSWRTDSRAEDRAWRSAAGQKLDQLGERLVSVEGAVGRLDQRLSTVETEVGRVREQHDATTYALAGITARLAVLEERTDG